MLHPDSERTAKRAGITLIEKQPEAGEPLGSWWTVIKPGDGDFVWFWSDIAIPSGSVVRMTNGPLYILDGLHLKPLEDA